MIRFCIALAVVMFAICASQATADDHPATVIHSEASDVSQPACTTCATAGQTHYASHPVRHVAFTPARYFQNHKPARRAIGFVFCRRCR